MTADSAGGALRHEWRRHHWLRVVAPLISAAIGAAVIVALYHPGMMTPDSLDQYEQARRGPLRAEFQPPVMAWVWRALMRLWDDAGVLLLAHQLVFWSGLALIVTAQRMRAVAGAATVLLIGFLPPIASLLGVIWKDVGMGAALTLAIGLLLHGSRRQSRVLILASVLPAAYALAVRWNAVLAILPLAAWMFCDYRRASGRPAATPRRVVVAATAITGVMAVACLMLSEAIIETPSPPAPAGVQFSLLHDLAGMSVSEGIVLLPTHISRDDVLDIAMLRTLYNPADVNVLVYHPVWIHRFFTYEREEFRALARTWRRAVFAHPWAYLRHRLGVLRTQFHDSANDRAPWRVEPNRFGLLHTPSPAFDWFVNALRRTQPWLWRGWLYAVLACTLVVTGAGSGRWRSAAIAASGLLYVSSYAVISTGSDYRYIWWLVLATLIASVVHFGERHPSFVERSMR